MTRLIPDDILATLTIYAEVANQSFECKQAVAEVIIRRMRRHYNSDGTVAGTVARRFQFSTLNDDPVDNAQLIRILQLRDDDPGVADCHLAWETKADPNAQIDPARPELVPNAVMFCRSDTDPLPPWATPDKEVRAIGDITFYRN